MNQKKPTKPDSNPHLGSFLDDLLQEEGLSEDATNYAVKRVLAWQIETAMRDMALTKSAMARRMGTSRAHLDRLLDPENSKVQLDTVERAATAVGRRLRLVLI
jgi:antitoxin HicB